MLISAAQVRNTLIYTFFLIIIFYSLSLDTLNMVLCYAAGPCLSILLIKATSAEPSLPLHPCIAPSSLESASLFPLSPSPFLFHVCVLRCSVVSDSLRPHGLSTVGSSVHGILQARIHRWVRAGLWSLWSVTDLSEAVHHVSVGS